MFWFKKVKYKSQEEQIKKLNFEIIMNSIREINSGNISHIHTAYNAFATSDNLMIEEAAKAIGNILRPFTDRQMINLDDRFRQYTSLEWSIDWRNVNILDSKNAIDNVEDWKMILILGSFHPNGFFREQCMVELAKCEGTLPYLILRMNDWVYQIRNLAFHLIIKKVKNCSIFEVLLSLQFLDKVKKSQRRETHELDIVYSEFIIKIEQNINSFNWLDICNYEFQTRKSIYKMLFSKPFLQIDEANTILEKDKHSHCKSIIIEGILSIYNCPLEQLDLYMKNKNSRVRLNSLQSKYDKVQNYWDGLEHMLLDSNHAIRDFTIYILKKNTNINVIDYYTNALDEDVPDIGIIAIGENGNKDHVHLLLPFLNNKSEKTVKYTLMALNKLMGYDAIDIFWKYLFDLRASVSKAAYLSIQKNKIRFGAAKLFHEFNNCTIPHIRRNLLLLLMQDNSWLRLPYLLSLYNYYDIDLRDKIRKKIEQRNVYENVSSQTASYIKDILKEKENEMPDNLIRQIEFDLYLMGY